MVNHTQQEERHQASRSSGRGGPERRCPECRIGNEVTGHSKAALDHDQAQTLCGHSTVHPGFLTQTPQQAREGLPALTSLVLSREAHGGMREQSSPDT